MPEDSMLLACIRDGLPHLENLALRMNGLRAEHALKESGITEGTLTWLQKELPRLITITRGLLTPEAMHEAGADPEKINVARRIRRYTADPFNGCMRWTGGTMGAGKRGSPSPTISFRGKMVPARRLAWQLRYEGTDRELGDKDRLLGEGCYAGSLCMNLDHWRKASKKPDLGTVRAALYNSPLSMPDGRLCQAGEHWIPADGKSCPGCRAVSRQAREGRDGTNETAKAAGYAIRKALGLVEDDG